jgi:GGDEF domain-containing protein
MPNFAAENQYQAWVNQNRHQDVNGKPNDFKTPGMDEPVNVDDQGNGTTVDLRRAFIDHAQRSPITGQPDADPSGEAIDKYRTEFDPKVTKDSMFADKLDADNLGHWETGDDGKRTWREPGYVAPTLTDKVVGATKSALGTAMSKVKDVAAAAPAWMADQNAQAVDDIKHPSQLLDNAASATYSTLQGLGESANKLGEGATTLAGAAPVVYDQVRSLFTGKDDTSAEDWWFSNSVDKLKDRDSAFDLAKDAGLTDKLAHGFGDAMGTIATAVIAPELEVGDVATQVTARVAQRVGAGAASMTVPATSAAVNTGRDVLEKTGDKQAAVKAAAAQYLITSASGAVPAAVAGTLPVRLASGAAIGAGQAEASRRLTNAAMPADMQTPYDPEQTMEGAAMGAGFGYFHGGTPATPGADPGQTGGFDPNNIPGNTGGGPPGGPAGLPSPSGFDPRQAYADFHDGLAAGSSGDTATALSKIQGLHKTADGLEAQGQTSQAADVRQMANSLARKTGLDAGDQPAPNTPAGKRAETAGKVALISHAATDAGDIEVQAGDDGHTVTVAGEPVAKFQTAAAADNAADAAKDKVDDRRVDTEQRKRVADMTSDEKDKLLLTHELTGIPNLRAFNEAPRAGSVASLDVDGLGKYNEFGHEAGDTVLKTVAQALHEELPDGAFHKSGDEFIAQGNQGHAALDAALQKVSKRLEGAELTFAHPDGRVMTVKGIRFSHAVADSYQNADAQLDSVKRDREAAGLRAPKGSLPPGASIAAPETGLQTDADQTPAPVKIAGQEVTPPAEPTPAQAEAGNYRKPTVGWKGIPIRIENIKGQMRRGVNPRTGVAWESKVHAQAYGYIGGEAKAADGEHVDVYMGPHHGSDKVFVIDQTTPDGKKYDEAKAIIGTGSETQARSLFKKHYPDNFKNIGAVTQMSSDEFKTWLKSGKTHLPVAFKPKPVSEAQREGDATKDSLLQYLARHPRGLDRDEAARQGIDPADFNDPDHFVGIKRPFRKGGMSFDEAAEDLSQSGYPVHDEAGNYSPNVLLDRIDRELRGDKVYSHMNNEHQFKALEENQRELEEASADRQYDISPDVPPLKEDHEEVQRMTALADEAMGYDRKAARDAIFNNDDRHVIQQKLQEIVDHGREAKTATPASEGVEAPSDGAPTPGSGEPILSSYTEKEVADRAEALAKADADRAQADRDAELRAQADRDRDAFSLTGSERTSDANPGQADMLGLSPQPRAEVQPEAVEKDEPSRVIDAFSKLLADDQPHGITDYRKAYEEVTGRKASGVEQKAADELAEQAVVHRARDIVAQGDDPTNTYDALVKLYDKQPNLSTRTSTSVENQAYSTPAPLAYLSSELAGITRQTTVLEPTAGNGMLLIAADPKRTVVNELNDDRVASLKRQGFDVTQKDASAGKLSDTPVDAVIANPPFGVVKENGASKQFDVMTPSGKPFRTTEIDHAIVFNALSEMKPDGKAVLLVGGPNKLARTPEQRSAAYSGAAKRKFYYHLYGNYNVVDHFTVDGNLYAKQGAAWPIDVIVVHGQGKSALDLPAAAPPRTYDSYKALEDVLGKDYGQIANDRVGAAERPVQTPATSSAVPGESEDGPTVVHDVARVSSASDDRLEPRPAASGDEPPGRILSDGTGEGDRQLPDRGSGGHVGSAEPVSEREGGQPDGVEALADENAGGGQPRSEERIGGGEVEPDGRPAELGDVDGSGAVSQRAYKPRSTAKAIGTLAPGNMGHSIDAALKALESRVGPVDKFVAKELGYDIKDIPKHFSAEQVDALGMAIEQLKKGAGFIIGDQTGVGKGRTVAGVIRWAIRQGHTPIFVTEKPALYAAMIEDLHDIGMNDIRPLMTNNKQKVPVFDGTILKTPANAIHEAHLQKLADEQTLGDHNMLFTTYNQMQSVEGKPTVRTHLLNALKPNAIVIFDESHNAGGTDAGRKSKSETEADGGSPKTGRAAFARALSSGSKGVFYSSATYAKRPNVMDLYNKTDMRLAVAGNVDKLPGAIMAGGVPLQQVVASQLAEAGQYIRREKSFDGIRYETVTVPIDKKVANGISSTMMAIKDFDDVKKEVVARIKKEVTKEGKLASGDGSKGMADAESANFTSTMHNLIGQMLVAMKAEHAVQRAIAALKNGEKPVITLANTMGSFLKEYAEQAGLKNGDDMGLSFRGLLERYLENSKKITITDADGNKTKRKLTDEELGAAGRAAFAKAKDVILNAPGIDDVPISPIDWIHHRLKEEGYSSGEITGRQHTIQYSGKGKAKYRLRPGTETSVAAKVNAVKSFNNGGTDAMILNQSGSTGISMHSSEKFKDQRPRAMLIAQAEGNIDTHMQILGRINRTGQMNLPRYEQLTADMPAEKRPAAVLAGKMASLNANTTASKTSAVTSKDSLDFLNQYGDEVVAQLMADMPDVHNKIGSPLPSGDDGHETEGAARKVTGRLAILQHEEQEEIYGLIESNYKDRLAQADAMGENALEAKTLPLDAKSLQKMTLTEGDSSSTSPFAAPSHAETMDVKRIGKPYTSEQMRGMAAKSVGMEGTPTLAQIADRGRRVAQNEMQNIGKEYQDYRNAEEAKMLKSDMPEKGREGRLVALDGTHQQWRQMVSFLHVGGSYEFKVGDQSLYGVITEVNRKKGVKMPVALGAWTAKVALADGSKQMTVPFSKIAMSSSSASDGKIAVSPTSRNQLTGASVEQMFDDGQSVSREQRVIMTGNLLAAYGQVKGGQIIHFTDNKNQVRQGIMMPRTFNLKEHVEGSAVKVPAARAVEFLDRTNRGMLTTSDGALTLQRMGSGYAFIAPKSKSGGGRYFLDQGLRDIVGDFTSTGNSMRAMVDRHEATRAAKYIEDTFNQRFETVAHREDAIASGGEAIGTKKADDEPQYSENPPGWDVVGDQPKQGLSADEVSQQVAGIAKRFGIDPNSVKVHPDLDSLRNVPGLAHVPDLARDIAGIHQPSTGLIHLIAGNLYSPSHVAETFAHEFVHHGLDSTFGRETPEWNAILDGAAKAMPAETRMRGEQRYGSRYQPTNAAHRRGAANETLAYYGQKYLKGETIPDKLRRFVDKYLAKIRDFVRRVLGMAPKFDDLYIRRVLNDIMDHARGIKSRGDEARTAADAAYSQKADTFYSGVARAVDAAKRDKGTGPEWEATLRNTPGVKKEEMEWMGLKDWLEGQGRVTKQEVADYVNAHRVQVQEVHRGHAKDYDAINDALEAHGYRMSIDPYDDGEAMYFDKNNGNEALPFEDLPDEVKKVIDDNTDGMQPPKYETYATPGGKNYREMLLTLPETQQQTAFREARNAVSAQIQRNSSDYFAASKALSELTGIANNRLQSTVLAFDGSTDPDAHRVAVGKMIELITKKPNDSYVTDALNKMMAAREEGVALSKQEDELNERPPARPAYRSNHWDEKNVLAHVRFDDREGPNGERVLHVHEVQSDWHQAGRREGYQTPITPDRIPTTAKRMDGHWEVSDQDGKFITNVMPADPDQSPLRTEAQALAEAARRMRDEPQRVAAAQGDRVPDAPFKTSWPELAMKRMLRMAVEGGYDHLTWDTGSTNADRYDMQQHVGSIKAVKRVLRGGDDYDFRVHVKSPQGNTLHNGGVGPAGLARMVGKDLAERIINQPPGQPGITYDGLDLKVGGEGMKGFYDDILPQSMNKIVKKMGSSVEPMTLRTKDQHETTLSVDREIRAWMEVNDIPQMDLGDVLAANRDGKLVHGSNPNEPLILDRETLMEANALNDRWHTASMNDATENSKDLPVYAIAITDKMRDSVMAGQPMFNRNEDLAFARNSGPKLPSTGPKDEDTLFGKPGFGGKAYGVARRAVALAAHNPITADFEKLFNPAGMDPFAEHTAQIATVYLGKLAQDRFQAQEHLQQFSRAINKMSPAQHLDMIDAIETGKPQPNPDMQPIADAMRKMLDTWRDNVRGLGTGHLENFLENYFPHYWKDESKAKSLFASIQGRRPLKGPATFLKKRTIPTTKEGISYGLTPATTNPLILTLLKVNEMQRYISGVSMMRGLKDAALAQFVSATKGFPDGWTKIDDAIGSVSKWSEAEGGFVHYGNYFMPTNAARIINNHTGRSKLADVAAVQVFKRFSNTMNAWQLSVSGFHLGFTTLDAMISKNALGLERLLHGEPLQALKAFAEGSTPFGAAMNIARGIKLLNAYANPGNATPEMRAIVAALTMGGGRAHMDSFYSPEAGGSPFRGVGPRSLMADVKAALTQPQGKVSALTKAIGSFPLEKAQEVWNAMRVMFRETPKLALPFEAAGRMARVSSALIMQHIVPMQKLGVFSDMAADWIRRNPDAEPQDMARAMQSIWRSVDNRLGEMVYDNLFWDRTFKDGMHLAFRAVGWNWGDYREIGGAPVDFVKLLDKGMRTGKISADDVGHKIPYVFSMVLMTSIIGGALGYLYGRKPETAKDLVFPRTGTYDKDGTEQRISLPSYMKDVVEYAQAPGETTIHKLAPIWNTAAELWQGQDYFGNPIWNPDESDSAKFRDGVTFFAQQYRPFSFTNQRQFGEVPGAKGDVLKYGTAFGLTPAPGSITKPEKIAEFQQYEARKGWIKKLTHDLKKARAAGDRPAADEALSKLKDAERAARIESQNYSREKAKTRTEQKQRAAQGKTGALMDTIGPLLDQGGSRAEQAQRIHAAGYPALAGLIGSLPEVLRPQMANALREA